MYVYVVDINSSMYCDWNTTLDVYEDFINVPFGVRRVGNPKSYFVDSKEKVKAFIENNNGRNPCFISIGTILDSSPILLDFIFDLDGDINQTKKDAINIYNFFVEMDYRTFITFSGRKGFHVHVMTKPAIYTPNLMRRVAKEVISICKAKTVDAHCIGQPLHLIRIPTTIHEATGHTVDIINFNNGKEFDLTELVIPDETDVQENLERTHNGIIPYHPYPCLDKLIREPEPRQLVRFGWVVYMKLLGYSYEEVVAEMCRIGKKYWVDFDERYTIYQIRHIWERNYAMPSCSILKFYNYCIKCPYDISEVTGVHDEIPLSYEISR